MANDPSITVAAQNAACNAIVDLLDAGNEAAQLRIYDGTPPDTVNDALVGNTLLAALVMSDPAYGNASNGIATASAISDDASADNGGTATFHRQGSMNSGTFTPVIQGTVGTSGSDLNLVDTTIVQGGPVEITSLTYTQPG